MSGRRYIGRAELARRLDFGTVKTFQRHRPALEAGTPPIPKPVPDWPHEVWDEAAIAAWMAARSGYSLEAEAADRRAARIEADRQELRRRLPLLRRLTA